MYPLANSHDLSPLISDIADRPVVMLGEASHGTHEYYTWRTAISKRLIEEKQFRFIAVEGDWPDCYLINRYVKGYPDAGEDIIAVLKQFDRWPTTHRSGMVNIGQLAREEYGENKVYLTGFAGYQGTAIAGGEWDAPMQEMEVPEARKNSIEEQLHREFGRNGLLLFSEQQDERYQRRIDHRAIGVVYSPERERWGNYVPSVLGRRYDAMIFLDDTSALHPLYMHEPGKKMPDTYPFGL
jgi:erythromycin esterase-like protein